MADIDPIKGACITSQLSGHRGRFLAIKGLATYLGLPKEIVDLVESVSGKVNDAAEGRHRTLHDAWYDYSGVATQFRAMPARQPAFGLEPVDKKKLESTISLIRKRADACEELKGQLVAELSALREKRG
jgi:hypothetical protein